MPRRFFYVHVQKAAGTELRERLKRHFAPEAMYPDKTDGDLFSVAPQVSVGQLLRRWEQRKAEIEIITGHFPYSTIELLDAEFVTLSVLREPVERTLSHLRHHRKMTPETRDLSLEALYDEVFLPVYFHNHMVKMFSLTADEIAASAEKNTWAAVRAIDFTPERLARAKDQVSRLDVLGRARRLRGVLLGAGVTIRLGARRAPVREPHAHRSGAGESPRAHRRRQRDGRRAVRVRARSPRDAGGTGTTDRRHLLGYGAFAVHSAEPSRLAARPAETLIVNGPATATSV